MYNLYLAIRTAMVSTWQRRTVYANLRIQNWMLVVLYARLQICEVVYPSLRRVWYIERLIIRTRQSSHESGDESVKLRSNIRLTSINVLTQGCPLHGSIFSDPTDPPNFWPDPINYWWRHNSINLLRVVRKLF